MDVQIYKVKFIKSPDGLLSTWTIEGMDFESVIDLCVKQKKEWGCTAVAVLVPTKRLIQGWSLVKLL